MTVTLALAVLAGTFIGFILAAVIIVTVQRMVRDAHTIDERATPRAAGPPGAPRP